MEQAESEIMIVDPYFGSASFARLFSSSFQIPIKILCGKDALSVCSTAIAFTSQTGIVAEVNKTRKAHDRLIIVDGSLF